MQNTFHETFEERPSEVLQPMIHQDISTTTDDELKDAQNVHKLQKQQQLLMVDTLGQLHHYVGPENLPELEAIHASAPTTAAVYVSSVLLIYLFGLFIIFIHHMNSAYGAWAWTLSDAKDELKPLWSWAQRRREDESMSPRRRRSLSSGMMNSVKSQKRARFANEFDEEDFPEEVLTPKTTTCPQNTSAIVHEQDAKITNLDLITSISDPGPNYEPKLLKHSSILTPGIIQRIQTGYAKFRINSQESANDIDKRETDISLSDQTRRMTNCSAFSSTMSHDIVGVQDESSSSSKSNLYINAEHSNEI